VFERFSSSAHTCFSVVDENDKLTGVLTMEAVRYVLGSGATLANLVVAKDMSMPAVTIERNQTLHEAIAAMVANKRREVLVVDAEAMHDLVAVITDTDITAILEGYEKH
jgi:predicted transcriptional regulator